MSTSVSNKEGCSFCGISGSSSSSSTTNIDHGHHGEDVEAVLVQGMKHLTFNELQTEQEYLHGVSDTIREDADFVNSHLQSLSEHLNQMKGGTDYQLAEQQNASYVSNRDFMLLFLRANRYDAKAAAQQMIKFFALKRQLFGEQSLARDITQGDMNEDDMVTLRCGCIQVGRCTDSSGRKIYIGIAGVRSYSNILNDLRTQFYVGMKLLKSRAGAPNKGIVIVSYQVGEFLDITNGDGFIETMQMMLTLPLGISGFHLCLESKTHGLIAKASLQLMSAKLRARTKIHVGSHVECRYILSTYGIPSEALPFSSSTNKIDRKYHLQWLDQVAKEEKGNNIEKSIGDQSISSQPVESPESDKRVDFPTQNDVLCIGCIAKHSLGNQRLLEMANSFGESYDKGSIKQRREIVSSILDEIQKHGGRFLKPDVRDNDTGDWVVLCEKSSREKITQTFRNLRRRRVGSRAKDTLNLTSYATLIPMNLAENLSSTATSSLRNPSLIESVVDISTDDVLFGNKVKGQRGNSQLLILVEEMAPKYNASSRGEKKELAKWVVDKVKDGGGRFLRHIGNNRWEVVPDKAAEEKVSVHFRNLRRKRR